MSNVERNYIVMYICYYVGWKISDLQISHFALAVAKEGKGDWSVAFFWLCYQTFVKHLCSIQCYGFVYFWLWQVLDFPSWIILNLHHIVCCNFLVGPLFWDRTWISVDLKFGHGFFIFARFTSNFSTHVLSLILTLIVKVGDSKRER